MGPGDEGNAARRRHRHREDRAGQGRHAVVRRRRVQESVCLHAGGQVADVGLGAKELSRLARDRRRSVVERVDDRDALPEGVAHHQRPAGHDDHQNRGDPAHCCRQPAPWAPVVASRGCASTPTSRSTPGTHRTPRCAPRTGSPPPATSHRATAVRPGRRRSRRGRTARPATVPGVAPRRSSQDPEGAGADQESRDERAQQVDAPTYPEQHHDTRGAPHHPGHEAAHAVADPPGQQVTHSGDQTADPDVQRQGGQRVQRSSHQDDTHRRHDHAGRDQQPPRDVDRHPRHGSQRTPIPRVHGAACLRPRRKEYAVKPFIAEAPRTGRTIRHGATSRFWRATPDCFAYDLGAAAERGRSPVSPPDPGAHHHT